MRLIEMAQGDDIAASIASGDIAIIRGFAPTYHCIRCIEEAIEHGPSMVGEAVYERGVSFLSTYDGGSPIGYYRFYRGPADGLGSLRLMYERMRQLSGVVRSGLGCGDGTGSPYDYHLEILRYQRGNFFERHVHEPEPQRVGLICLLSEHYPGQGGTVFYSGEDVVETAETMRRGDLLLFPWGIEHEVTRVDGDERWVALLPYY